MQHSYLYHPGLANGDLVTLPAELPPPGEAASTSAPPSPERTIRTKRNLTEGPVLQLHADSSRSMLLALGRSGVRAFRLPQLLLRAEAPGTNGCDRFAWHERSGTLVASYRRKLYVYAYEGLEFVRRRDVTLPDRVACLAFSGALLCVGTAREYLAVDLVGFPGEGEGFLELERYLVLARAGLETLPLSYALWTLEPELALQALLQRL